MNSNSFFLLGCQRSGTTLMRLILDSHSKIHCYDETKSYQILQKYGTKFPENIINKNDLIGFKVLGYTEQMTNSTLTELVNHTVIPNLYSDKKIIFMYRDVRDVISSMKNYIQKNNKSWLDNWIVLTIDFWKKNIPEFTLRYKNELEIIKNHNQNIIAFAALYWKFKINSMIQCKEKNFSLIKVKYDDLVFSPKKELTKVMDFLEIPWNDSLLNHNNISHSEVNASGFTIGKNDAKLAIHTKSSGKFINELSEKQLDLIYLIAGDLMNELGYGKNNVNQ